MRSRAWLAYALVTTGFWGVWGAFTGLPANHGFPETLIYAVWALTMIPPALYGLRRVGWRLQRDARSVCYGAMIGLLPGPEMRSSGGTSCSSPISSRSRGLVRLSIAITLSRSAGSVTLSNSWITGNRLGTMR